MTDKSYKYYVGIDVSKYKLDVVKGKSDSSEEYPNDLEGLNALVKTLKNKKETLIVLEATGAYEKLPANYLRKKKYHVAVVSAQRVRDFAKASGKLAKTDSVDAKGIKMFGKVFNPKAQAMLSKQNEELKDHVSRKGQLVKMLAKEKQHLEKAPESVKEGIKKHIAFLKEELSAIEEVVKEQINQDAELKDKVKRLDEIKGVGITTATTVVTFLPELGKLTSKQVAALVGTAPFNKDSGKRQGKRKICGGRKQVRSILYMAILSAIRFNPAIKKFYDRLIKKGKLKKVAMVACMRKLIIVMNAMIRDGTRWNKYLTTVEKNT